MEYVWTTGKRFLVIFLQLTRSEIIIKEFIILLHKVPQDRFHRRLEQELLSRDEDQNRGAQFQCRRLHEGRRP